MQTAAEQTKLTAPGRADERLAFALVLLTACPTFAFAFWTVTCHICVIGHFSFGALAKAGPIVVAAGLLCGILVARLHRETFSSAPRTNSAEFVPNGRIYIAGAAALVAAYGLGVGYSAFWIACLLLLSFAFLQQKKAINEQPTPPVASSRPQKTVLLCLVLVSPILTYVAHRPDIDDAVYVGTAADAVAHPQLPVLSHDAIYGDQKLPLMLPSYAVESYSLFIALLARWFGGAPILWAHAIVPTILAALIPIVWARLMRILTPKHWAAGTVVALVALSLPADFRGFGNFAFVRLFQAKAVLVSIGIPLLYSFAWKFEETGSLSNWITLFAGTIACVGLSSSAIFVAPLALVAAALSGWRKGSAKRAALVLLPAAYPLACGLAVSKDFGTLQQVFAHLPASASFAITSVFAAHTQYVFLFALLAAPFVARDPRMRRLLTVLALAYFVIAINPFTFKFLSKFTTRDAVWRLLWCVPVPAVVAAACITAVELAGQWRKRWAVVAAIVLVCGTAYLAPYSSWAKENGVTYSLRPLKVPISDYEIARQAIAATPPHNTVLAPENIAVWIPAFVHRAPLVSVRKIYDDEMGAHLSPEDARTRRELREFVSGEAFSFSETQPLPESLARYHVGLVVAPSSLKWRIAPAIAQARFAIAGEENGYIFFSKAQY